MDLQWRLLPHKEILLLDPVARMIGKSDVEIKNDKCQNKAHFAVGKTMTELGSSCSNWYRLLLTCALDSSLAPREMVVMRRVGHLRSENHREIVQGGNCLGP